MKNCAELCSQSVIFVDFYPFAMIFIHFATVAMQPQALIGRDTGLSNYTALTARQIYIYIFKEIELRCELNKLKAVYVIRQF